METALSKFAKVVFIICASLFVLQDKSLYAVNFVKELVINNALIFAAIAIIFLVWGAKNERRKK